MEVLLLIIMCLSNILCFTIGARVGQKVVKGERIEMPNLDPMKAARERQERREAQREQDKLDAILHNIDSYNGTGEGQKSIPGR